MGFKTIDIEKEASCPSCGSKEGITFFMPAKIEYWLRWGVKGQKPKMLDAKGNGEIPRTAVCAGCEKRFEIKK